MNPGYLCFILDGQIRQGFLERIKKRQDLKDRAEYWFYRRSTSTPLTILVQPGYLA